MNVPSQAHNTRREFRLPEHRLGAAACALFPPIRWTGNLPSPIATYGIRTAVP